MKLQINYLKKYIKENNLTQQELADQLEVTRQYLNLILNGNKPISPGIALKLEKITPKTSGFWLSNEEKSISSTTEIDALISLWKKQGSRLLVDHEIKTARELGYIDLHPFKTSNLRPSSYCLTIGNKIRLSHDKELIKLDELDNSGTLTIQPNDIVAIMTEEEISLPRNITARLSPKTDIIDHVLNLNHGGKIHPGYRGPIYIVLENHTKRVIEIKRGMEILHLDFNFLHIDPETDHKGEKELFDDFPEKLIESLREIDIQRKKAKSISESSKETTIKEVSKQMTKIEKLLTQID